MTSPRLIILSTCTNDLWRNLLPEGFSQDINRDCIGHLISQGEANREKLEKETVSGIILTLILIGMMTLTFNIPPAKSESVIIHIRADGSIEPSTAPIHRDGDVYILTGNITDSIVIERNNMTLDGAGYTLQKTVTVSSNGISLSGSNVTIRNTKITEFDIGIGLFDSRNNTISENTITKSDEGITVYSGSGNSISENIIANNKLGIVLTNCYFSCNISGNTIANNGEAIRSILSSNNSIYHNNFIGNTKQLGGYRSADGTWDDGYPSGGNYWSDYTGADANHDGIGDTPYRVGDFYKDRYPLMSPWGKIPEWVLLTPPFWTQWWFYAIVAVVIVALGGAVYLRARARESQSDRQIVCVGGA